MTKSPTQSSPAAAQELAARLTPDSPQPDLTEAIADSAAPAEAKAGMFLLNGDWKRAHETAQDLESPLAAYWHALVHRHEPDFDNSKYWLRRVGTSPVFAELLAAARNEGKSDLVTRGESWDAARFTDCYADPKHHDWTRRIERIELDALLKLSLES